MTQELLDEEVFIKYLDWLQKERDKYDRLMFEILEWTLHMLRKWEVLVVPITQYQKKRDYFLYKFYEFKLNEIDSHIDKFINQSSDYEI